jgi:regulator of protease activity HflC (stomatin/prohibitin superfamily)
VNSSGSWEPLIKTLVFALLFCSLFILLFLLFGLKAVPEGKMIVLLRLGRSVGSRGPGLVTLIPFIDQAIWVDLHRTFRFDYSDMPAADDSNIPCVVTVEGKVVDPEKSVLEVSDLEKAISQLIQTGLREVAGGQTSNGSPASTAWIERWLWEVLDQPCRSWGFEVVNLVIENLKPE